MNTNGTINITGKKETSKTFKRLGKLVNIKAISKSQRGIIARKYLHRIDKEQLQKIEEGLNNKWEVLPRLIPVKSGGKVIDYI